MAAKYPTVDKVKTGQRLRYLMSIRGVSVKDIQKYLGLSTPQAVYHWLHGRSMPTVDNVYALSELLRVPLDIIICGNKKNQGDWYGRVLQYAYRLSCADHSALST